MARPLKQGLDYYPLDVEWDEKVELLISENGSDAISVMVTAWQLIYKNGYYIENGNDLFFMIRRRTMLDVKIIEKIINSAISRKLFNKDLHEKYNILTSKAIQDRYCNATSRREGVNVYRNYCLLDISEHINVTLVEINDDISTQSKVK